MELLDDTIIIIIPGRRISIRARAGGKRCIVGRRKDCQPPRTTKANARRQQTSSLCQTLRAAGRKEQRLERALARSIGLDAGHGKDDRVVIGRGEPD